MKKITIFLSCTALLACSSAAFSTVSLSAHPAKLPTTGDVRGKIHQVIFSNRDNNPWVRLVVGEKDRKYTVEFKGDDLTVGNTLLDAKGKYIDALYSYTNGAYVVNFFEIT